MARLAQVIDFEWRAMENHSQIKYYVQKKIITFDSCYNIRP